LKGPTRLLAALLKRLVDAELRRREAAEAERLAVIKQRFLESKV
jgi:hypothetical protein